MKMKGYKESGKMENGRVIKVYVQDEHVQDVWPKKENKFKSVNL